MQGTTKTLIISPLIALLISSCGDSDTQLVASSSTDTSRVTINITDAPVDDADAVVVEFTGITLKSEDDGDQTFLFETPKSIDLLALQGTTSQPLLDSVEIPAGNYTQIRLAVNAEFDSNMDSFITINNVQHELRVPSGSQSGLKLNTPFTVAAGSSDISVADENSIYTIDFDLRKSIVNPTGQNGYLLKPVLRLVQNLNTGSISGTIQPSLLTGLNCSDNDPLTGNAVYVFSDANTIPDDIDDIAAEPLTTSLVSFDTTSGDYNYEIGFILEGSYTLAFTCSADLDDENDNANVVFDVVDNVTVTAGESTAHTID